MRTLAALPLIFGLSGAPAEAKEPSRAELVDVKTLVPDLIVDKPYATEDNFTGQVVYPASDTELVNVCLMTREAAENLKKADDHLKANTDGWRLVAWDCYRPTKGQQHLWDSYGCDTNPGKCSGFVAPPGRSNHQRGRAFDGTLADKDGNILEAPTEYDHFGKKARPSEWKTWTLWAQSTFSAYSSAMNAAGCTIISSEWWHANC